MSSTATKNLPSSRAPQIIFLGALIGSVAIYLLASYKYSYEYFFKSQVVKDIATSRLVANGLGEHLKRFEAVPSLLAQNLEVQEFFKTVPPSAENLKKINLALKQVNADVGASDTYLIGRSGTATAASNFDLPHSFIGRDLSFRPYVQNAIEGEKSKYFALGTTSLKRGYYFSAPIKTDQKVVGVAAVKIAVDHIEAGWKNQEQEVIVVDDYGIVFLSTQNEWLFKSIGSLRPNTANSDNWIDRITQTKQYPLSQLGELRTEYKKAGLEKVGLLTFYFKKTPLGPNSQTFIASPTRLDTAGWTVYVLSAHSIIDRLAYSATFMALLLVLTVMILAGFAVYRRSQLLKNIELQTLAKRELEFRVDERTRDLKVANDTLTLQIEERRRAEEKLRSTQQELVQAGKLAALGQLSAGLSHELNQPLAAIRTYADNAQEFLARNTISKAAENLGHIKTMSERMTELTKHLRNFARKPNLASACVDLQSVFQAVEIIMKGRLKDIGAEIKYDFDHRPLFVIGGEGRLQQVFVNIFNNSLDAMKDLENPIIEVSVEHSGAEMIIVNVRDYGHGLKAGESDKIFDPFFTTKGVNEGLGLGLSISYNVVKDFGGDLSCSNHRDGGALFSVKLMLCETEKMVAE